MGINVTQTSFHASNGGNDQKGTKRCPFFSRLCWLNRIHNSCCTTVPRKIWTQVFSIGMFTRKQVRPATKWSIQVRTVKTSLDGVRSQRYLRQPRSPVPTAYINVANGEVTGAKRAMRIVIICLIFSCVLGK